MKRVLTVIRDYIKSADMLLLALCVLSSALGVVIIYSATLSYETSSYVYTQVIAILLGVALFVLLSILDVDIISSHWLILLAFNVLFIATLFFWGEEGGTGNRSWLRFGGTGVQPAEIVKVTFVILLAKQFSFLRDSKGGVSSIPAVLMLLGHFALMFGLIIVASSDLGSALVFAVIFVVMAFAAGVKLRWFILGAAGIAAAAPFVWNNLLADYQRERILAPYFPSQVDPSGLGITWQANQSRIALASGQFWGQGFTNGTQAQSAVLPHKHTDFIFSVAGEEFGMVGCIVIILLLSLIIIRCIRDGVRSQNYMNMLICTGVAAMLIFQTFENIGMCLGLTPVIGLTLPFFSAGGSSIITLFAAMGIISGIHMRPNPLRR